MVFLNNWNEFYFASILLKSKGKMTIPALLGQFTTAYSKNLNGMFSAIIVSVVPTILIFCLLSETFVKSLTAGAVKAERRTGGGGDGAAVRHIQEMARTAIASFCCAGTVRGVTSRFRQV